MSLLLSLKAFYIFDGFSLEITHITVMYDLWYFEANFNKDPCMVLFIIQTESWALLIFFGVFVVSR